MEELTLHFLYLCDGFHHVNGDSDSSCLIRDGTGYGLSDPPCSICRKLESLCVVKLIHSLDQSEVALLYQVKELHSAADVFLRDAYHQTEVGFAKALLCGRIAVCHALGKLDLLLGGEQGNAPDLLEVELYGVVREHSVCVIAFVSVLGFRQVDKALNIQVGGIVIDDLYIKIVKFLVKPVDLLRVKIQLLKDVCDLLCGEASFLLSLCEQVTE